MEQEYINLRNKYIPENLRVVFVLESPPQGHGYFYDSEGKVSEVSFRAFMKLIGFTPTKKEEGLKELARQGIVLINPTYIPVNKLPDKEADKIILENYKIFLADLEFLLRGNKTIPLILVKSNILRLLEKPLHADGFNVVNESILVPFPLHYHANSFHEKVSTLLEKGNLRMLV